MNMTSEMEKDSSEKSYSINIKEVDAKSTNEAEQKSTNFASSPCSRDETRMELERWKRVSEPRIRKVVRGLSRGNTISLTDEALLKSHNVKAVVIMGPEQECAVRDWLEGTTCISQNHVKSLSCSMPLQRDVLFQLSDVCDFIDRYAVGRSFFWPHINSYEHSPEARVLVTTYGDYYEGTMLIYAYEMRNHNMTLDNMIDYMHDVEGFEDPDILYLDAACMRILQIWWLIDFEVWEDKAKGIPKDLSRYFRERYVSII